VSNNRIIKITSKILTIPWFWLNYILLLIIILPFPLLEITVNGQKVRSVPLWECYTSAIKGKFTPQLFIVFAIHLLLTFIICFVIWAFIYRADTKKGNDE